MNTASASAPLVKVSVGKKVLVAATGMALMLFLVAHLTGNFLLMKSDGGAAFDAYAHFMKTTPLVWGAELGLFGVIIFHIVATLTLNVQNRRARGGARYLNDKNQGTFFSRYMVHTGIIFLIFLLLHLYSFFFSHKVMSWLTGAPAAGLPESLYAATKMKLSEPLYSGFYVLSMVALAFHLTHGFWSAFQTLGWVINLSMSKLLRSIAVGFAVIISAAFAIIPLYFLFTA